MFKNPKPYQYTDTVEAEFERPILKNPEITFTQGLFHQKNINIQCRFSWQSALVSTSNCDYDTNAFHIWTHLCRGALKSSIERDQMWDSPGNSTFRLSY
jgi:hypothetical protein